MGKLIDLTGQRFGRLIVLHRGEKVKHNETVKWYCKCDCGNCCWVDGPELRKGETKSCGCLRIERLKEKKGQFVKDLNYYEIKNDMCYVYNDTQEKYCIIDVEDLPRIAMYHWRENSQGYWVAYARYSGKNTTIQLHKLITNTGKEIKIDHRNRKRNDCRKNNLRICTSTQNCQNITIRKNNRSGIIGVYSKDDYKWEAYIQLNKKRKSLGYFNNKEDAIKARLEAEAIYYKEFAPQRHLFEQYGIEVDNEEQAN